MNVQFYTDLSVYIIATAFKLAHNAFTQILVPLFLMPLNS